MVITSPVAYVFAAKGDEQVVLGCGRWCLCLPLPLTPQEKGKLT